MPLEANLQKSVVKYIQSCDCCDAEVVHGSVYQRGRPDINASVNGALVRIELKTPDHGNTPSDLQVANLKRWARTGAICFVAYSLREVKGVISRKGRLRCHVVAVSPCPRCPVFSNCYTKERFL